MAKCLKRVPGLHSTICNWIKCSEDIGAITFPGHPSASRARPWLRHPGVPLHYISGASISPWKSLLLGYEKVPLHYISGASISQHGYTIYSDGWYHYITFPGHPSANLYRSIPTRFKVPLHYISGASISLA